MYLTTPTPHAHERIHDLRVAKITRAIRSPFKMTHQSSPPKASPSTSTEGPWQVDTPFGPPQVQRSFPNGGIRRIRDTLHKLSPSGIAEKELLRKKNQYKIPLTHRNVDTFVTEQECNDACRPNQRTPEIQVAEWLAHVA